MIGARVGLRVGLAVGLAVGISADPIAPAPQQQPAIGVGLLEGQSNVEGKGIFGSSGTSTVPSSDSGFHFDVAFPACKFNQNSATAPASPMAYNTNTGTESLQTYAGAGGGNQRGQRSGQRFAQRHHGAARLAIQPRIRDDLHGHRGGHHGNGRRVRSHGGDLRGGRRQRRRRDRSEAMTDAQFAALLSAVIAGLGGVAATLRWAVGRITKAIDDNTASNAKLTDAQIGYAARMAEMATKLDHVASWVHEHTPVEGVPLANDEIEHSRRQITSPISTRGYRPPRPGPRDD